MYTTNSYKFTSYCQLVTLERLFCSGYRFGYKYGMIWHGSNLCFPCITVCWSMLPHHQLDVWISWVAQSSGRHHVARPGEFFTHYNNSHMSHGDGWDWAWAWA